MSYVGYTRPYLLILSCFSQSQDHAFVPVISPFICYNRRHITGIVGEIRESGAIEEEATAC